MTYDAVDQVISASFKDTVTQAIVKRFVYGYDKGGNRTGEQIDDWNRHARAVYLGNDLTHSP